ncbi:MAG: SPASM domain-containing protein [Desulfobacterales bacterium]|nr:SPASM domain-containing protein [Desulfobacterales bacterium]MBF0397083.1 SPASM domain-containing protein [Desulfobacterales bacterium]
MRYRYENFGGIISSESPAFLAYVDRDYMLSLGFSNSSLWNTFDTSINLLSAPTEVHFAITNKCSVYCPHCYMGAGTEEIGELSTELFKDCLNILSSMKVFHIALGGGDALERPDLFEIADYARKIGIVPNLTISGINMTPNISEKMKCFGQINISMDGVYEYYSVFRGKNLFEVADYAIGCLVKAGISTGINCVVGKSNFSHIPKLFKYAAKKKLNEIEFLRLKPSGRCNDIYYKEKTTFEQNISLIPLLSRLSQKYGITAKIDCSFVPMLCYHNPPLDILDKMAAYGCEAGNVLLGIRSNGSVCGCSFLNPSNVSIFDFASGYSAEKYFKDLLSWTSFAKEPCKSCTYLHLCKGGCHAVAHFVEGSIFYPDPECPKKTSLMHGKRT